MAAHIKLIVRTRPYLALATLHYKGARCPPITLPEAWNFAVGTKHWTSFTADDCLLLISQRVDAAHFSKLPWLCVILIHRWVVLHVYGCA